MSCQIEPVPPNHSSTYLYNRAPRTDKVNESVINALDFLNGIPGADSLTDTSGISSVNSDVGGDEQKDKKKGDEDDEDAYSPDDANPYDTAKSTFSENLEKLREKTQALKQRAEQSETQAMTCQLDLARHKDEIKQRETDELRYIQEMNELILAELQSIESDLKDK